ncbi:hypothetical protein QF028_003066 [Neobacillus sp. B4I6]|uniref:hypothetical protein n=1 Tax=Neobacillus sp. B4I6 TaxID=3373925 RepID=UPI003D1AA1CB
MSKHARTIERPYITNRVLGLQTTVVFSDGTREVSYNFLKDGKKRGLELQNKTTKAGK